MNPETLLDAIGLVDDRFFHPEKQVRHHPFRRKLLALVAAVLMIAASVGTAMAVSVEFRELVFSIFHLESPEKPPVNTEGNTAPQSGLRKFAVTEIDGVVRAHYFTSDGFVQALDGGFYTWSQTERNAPDDGVFWEIRESGIVPVPTNRMDFPLASGDKQLQITFDYAILNGNLRIHVWPDALDEDPVGNGWDATPIGGRTDVVLLTVPFLDRAYYTQTCYLLNLETREVTDLMSAFSPDTLVLEGLRLTEDMAYALVYGTDRSSGNGASWVCDFEAGTMRRLDEMAGAACADPYFLDNQTLVFRKLLADDHFQLVKYHLPSGAQTVIVENTTPRRGGGAGYRGIQLNGGGGAHGLLFQEDGSVDLIDLHTLESMNMQGLDTRKLTTSESPDGASILIAYEEADADGVLGHGFSSLGLLHPDTGVWNMLTREVSGNPETFWGWLDRDTVAITARDDSGGYYVYVYVFQNGGAVT